MWQKVRLAAVRCGFWLLFKTRGYYCWSKLYRYFFEAGYQNQKLTQYQNLGHLGDALRSMKWVQDPLKGKLDIISSPKKVEHLYQLAKLKGERAEIGDCDEFAQYAADRIEEMRRRSVINIIPYFMTLNWFDNKGVFHGHNICAMEMINDEKGTTEWGHIGNWFGGRPQWSFTGPGDIAAWFAHRSPRDGNGVLIAWALASFDLRLKEIGM